MINKALTDMVIQFRKKSLLTQDELAKLAKISRTSIVNIEKGMQNPSGQLIHFIMTHQVSICPQCAGEGYIVTNKEKTLENKE